MSKHSTDTARVRFRSWSQLGSCQRQQRRGVRQQQQQHHPRCGQERRSQVFARPCHVIACRCEQWRRQEEPPPDPAPPASRRYPPSGGCCTQAQAASALLRHQRCDRRQQQQQPPPSRQPELACRPQGVSEKRLDFRQRCEGQSHGDDDADAG